MKSRICPLEKTTVSSIERLMIRAKNNREPVVSSLPPWSEWSACSVSCGLGEESRLRLCPDTGTNLDDLCRQKAYMKRNCRRPVCTQGQHDKLK